LTEPESSELAFNLYRHMCRVRRIDQRMSALQRQGRIGFFGSALGQEAPPVATALALEPDDWVFPALREGAVMLVRGFSLDTYLAQLFGNSLDLLKGRQMPSHQSARSVHQVSWSSAIGTQLPHAVGAAWAMRLRGARTVALAFLGDGATSTGDFHAAMNFAAVFRVPCVFVCQNNQYSISLPVGRQTAAATLADKAAAYAIVAERVDGNDALAVHAAVTRAVEHARNDGGPRFLECVTYRLGPHSSSDDPDRYRSADEVAEWERRDPIARLRSQLAQSGRLDTDTDARLSREIDDEITQAITRVEGAPPPAVDSLFDDVFARRPWTLEEQRRAVVARPPLR
jgi:pyruvate dehydrogenase E1 component alpha subunit/2-oxoisovalerate dehydrogenase E1 component alpha subunit